MAKSKKDDLDLLDDEPLLDGAPPADLAPAPPAPAAKPAPKAAPANTASGQRVVFGKYLVPEGTGKVVGVAERDFTAYIQGGKQTFLADELVTDPAVLQFLLSEQKPLRLERR